MDMEFSTTTFEGPLDLLLALVKKEEMDIMNIDIHAITRQYLQAIQDMPTINLKEGGEFIQMASTLLHIKSKYLLPQENIETETEEEPILSQEELAKALMEHNQFLKAGEKLNQRLVLNRDIWCCQGLSFTDKKEEQIMQPEDGLFSLFSAFKKTIKRGHLYTITTKLPSVFQWIHHIQSFFVKGRVFSFQKLTKDQNEPFVHQILLSFLSLLELGKLGVVSMVQKNKDIQIHTRKTIDNHVLALLRKTSYTHHQGS